jgi:hypothetical protein
MHIRLPHALLAVGAALLGAFPCPAQVPLQQPLQPTREITTIRALPTPFGDRFSPDVSGYNAVNAYLLIYLATTIFADQIVLLDPALTTKSQRDARELVLQRNPAEFEKEYRERLKGLFPLGTTFKFHSTRVNVEGWDAEAAVINAPKAIFIVVRGTDRSGNERSGFRYNWREWYGTDFPFNPMAPGNGIQGLVHKGFWMSLRENIRADILDQVKDILAATPGKKVWITGHSLGGGQSQLLGAYLKAKGVPIQGIYTWASPRVGNTDFTNWLNSSSGVGRTRIQRFDFGEDIITMVPWEPLFGNAGIRNYYKDVESLARNASEWGIRPPGNTCHHYHAWYLNSAWNQLDDNGRSGLPTPRTFGFPAATPEWMTCGTVEVKRGISETWITDTASETVQGIAWNASQLLGNLTGSVVEEGVYYIRCAKGMKHLDIPSSSVDEDGSKLQVNSIGPSNRNNKFRLVRETPYYRIETLYSANNQTLLVEAQAETLAHNAPIAQTWRRNMVPGMNQNQKWLFFRLPGAGNSNKYVIYNAAAMKVLHADAPSTDGGRVRLRKPVSNEAAQVWVLERAPN